MDLGYWIQMWKSVDPPMCILPLLIQDLGQLNFWLKAHFPNGSMGYNMNWNFNSLILWALLGLYGLKARMVPVFVFLSCRKQENTSPTKPCSIILYMACVWTSTWEGQTVIWGWEWYQPTTLRVLLVSSVNLPASVKAAHSCSGEISTRPFLLSECHKTMTEWMWTILTVSIFSATVWISVLVYVNLGSRLKSSFNSMHSPITSSFSVLRVWLRHSRKTSRLQMNHLHQVQPPSWLHPAHGCLQSAPAWPTGCSGPRFCGGWAWGAQYLNFPIEYLQLSILL